MYLVGKVLLNKIWLKIPMQDKIKSYFKSEQIFGIADTYKFGQSFVKKINNKESLVYKSNSQQYSNKLK